MDWDGKNESHPSFPALFCILSDFLSGGKANGPWTKWYGNGVREEGFYKNGKKHGEQVHFASDGSEISRVSYKDGYRLDKE